MTYIWKGAGLRMQQRRPIHSRDLLWIDVNSYAILNAYRQPLSLDVIDYVTHLAPPPNCLVRGTSMHGMTCLNPGFYRHTKALSLQAGQPAVAWTSLEHQGNPRRD